MPSSGTPPRRFKNPAFELTLRGLCWLKPILATVSAYTTKYNDLFDDTVCDWGGDMTERAEHIVNTLNSMHDDEGDLYADANNPQKMLLVLKDIDLYLEEVIRFASSNDVGQHILENKHILEQWCSDHARLRYIKMNVDKLLLRITPDPRNIEHYRDQHSFDIHKRITRDVCASLRS
jgi:hypothetical protein